MLLLIQPLDINLYDYRMKKTVYLEIAGEIYFSACGESFRRWS